MFPTNETSYRFGDNESVVNSLTNPYAKLHKRHPALSFHCVCEAVASKYIESHYIPGENNPADIVTKHWSYLSIWTMLQSLLFWQGDTARIDVKQ